MTGIWKWLRNSVREAILSGVSDALQTLHEAQEPAQLLLEHRETTEAPDSTDEPSQARGNGTSRGKTRVTVEK